MRVKRKWIVVSYDDNEILSDDGEILKQFSNSNFKDKKSAELFALEQAQERDMDCSVYELVCVAVPQSAKIERVKK